MIQKFRVMIVMFLALTASIFQPGVMQAKTQTYVDFPANYLPVLPTDHPRIYIQNRLPALKALYNTVPQTDATKAFQHDIDKLLTYTSAAQDWRSEDGWPAAALALHWLITGSAASGQKACDVFIPHFTGISKHNEETDLYYALAYDWLFNHPCFTNAMKANLRSQLIAWSDDTASVDENSSWIAHDTDRNIAATSGHFLGGLAILGEDQTNGLKLLKRGWTGWKYGLNTNDGLPDFPVTGFFRTSVETGIPLPGWDYGMMSDIQKGQNLYYVMDELGVIDAEAPELKSWWVNSLTYFMHSVDPANTHYRWIGDQQSDVHLDQGSGFIRSFLSNNIFMAEKYGFTNEAAIGRSFLDTLNHPSYGIGDGDTMLWFMTSWDDSAPRVDFKTKAPRYILGGLGPNQHMGIGMFRSDWTSTTSFQDSKQVTWGGFYGIGSYIADHMHNIAGSFWLWRNGEYLLTEPSNYQGGEAALYPLTLWNSLSIPNQAVPNNNEVYDNGGPIVYFNQGSAYLERGRADETNSIFYALLNGDQNYNVPDNPWAQCTGTCRQPVSKYTRSFVYDGLSEIVFLIDRVDLAQPRPAGLRFRTQNPSTLSTQIAADTVSIPSDQGNYRTLVRVLSPTPSTSWVMEKEPWASTVSNWQINSSMVGSQARLSFPDANEHRIVTVLQLGKSSDGSTQLSNADLIGSTAPTPDFVGACASLFCFITPHDNAAAFLSSAQYQTPSTMVAGSRHLVTDLVADACYSVTSSVSGAIATVGPVSAQDHTLLFNVPSGGAQGISLTQASCAAVGSSGPGGLGGTSGAVPPGGGETNGNGGSTGASGSASSGGCALLHTGGSDSSYLVGLAFALSLVGLGMFRKNQ